MGGKPGENLSGDGAEKNSKYKKYIQGVGSTMNKTASSAMANRPQTEQPWD
jgi:hypothetical protein